MLSLRLRVKAPTTGTVTGNTASDGIQPEALRHGATAMAVPA